MEILYKSQPKSLTDSYSSGIVETLNKKQAKRKYILSGVANNLKNGTSVSKQVLEIEAENLFRDPKLTYRFKGGNIYIVV